MACFSARNRRHVVIVMRRTWTTFATLVALASLAGCAAILGLEPTDVIDSSDGGNAEGGNGNDGGPSQADGGPTTKDSGSDTDGGVPAIEVACASAITVLDPQGAETNSIVVDASGKYWAWPQNASTSLIWADTGAGAQLIVGTQNGTSADDEATVMGLALDSNYLYWSSWDTYDTGKSPFLRELPRAGGAIKSADLSTPGVTGISELAIGGTKIYFGDWLATPQNAHLWVIPRGFADDGLPTSSSGGLNPPLNFAAGANFIFYDEASDVSTNPINQDSIAAASISMGNPSEFQTGLDGVQDIAVDDSDRVYYTDTNAHKIETYNADAPDAAVSDFYSTADPSTDPVAYPHLVAFDADHKMLYVAASSQDDVWSIQRFVIDGTGSVTPMPCVGNLQQVSAIHYFGGHVYFSAKSDAASALFDMTIK